MKRGVEEVDIIRGLVSIFPDFKERITVSYQENTDFREVAEDYLFCSRKIIRLRLTSHKDRVLLEHYERTLEELGEELMQHLIPDNKNPIRNENK